MALAAAASSSLAFQKGRDLLSAQKRNRMHRTAYCRLGLNSSGAACLVADRREQNQIPVSFSFEGEDGSRRTRRPRYAGRMDIRIRDRGPSICPSHLLSLDIDLGNTVPLFCFSMSPNLQFRSIEQIVRNVGDAPLLLQLYSKPNQGTKTRLEKQKAVAESWPLLQRRWKEGSRIPQGVILVERLKGMEDDGSNYWGLLVQGRGLDCGACYILKTNRVRSISGFCTHFCLVRAQCFGDSSELQMRNSWLLSPSDASPRC